MNIVVSDVIEKNACEDDINQGFDIADYVLNTNINGRAIYENGVLIEFEKYDYIHISDNKTFQEVSSF